MKIKMPNPSPEPPASSKTPNQNSKDMKVLFTLTLLATGSRDVGKPQGGAPGARVFRTALKATNNFFFAQNPSVYSFGSY